MPRINKFLCALFVSTLLHTAWAQAADSYQVLVRQGQQWFERDDLTRAAEAWNKLLRLDPNQPEALYGLGAIELKMRSNASAERFLKRLKQAHPQHRLVAQLEQDLLLNADVNKALLADARQAVAESDVNEATRKYREALGGRLPVGEVGRDYYHRLGYTDGGLLEAIEGLQRLKLQSPNDPLLQLALARHLARNEPTRLEALGRLAKLSENYDVGSEATESWRDALLWLGEPEPQNKSLYEAYLKHYPDDQDILELFQQASTAPPSAATEAPPDHLRERTDAGMKLIESGKPARARAEFRAVLAQRPDDSEALGGLGVLFMREGNWQQAHDYLARAAQNNSAWQPSLSTAQYWVDFERARRLLQEQKTGEARVLMESLVTRSAGEPAAKDLLADIYFANGDTALAMRLYQESLERHPQDVGLRIRLARLYQQHGQSGEAAGLVQELLAIHPYDPDVLYISALQASDAGDWEAVRNTMAQIPLDKRSVPMRHLAATAGLRLRIAEASALARSGDKAGALELLGNARAEAGYDFDIINAIAQSYVEMGEASKGLALLGSLRTQGEQRGTDASIAYIGLLLASGQTVEASVLLRHLGQQTLTDAQQARVERLTDVLRVRQASSLVERGDYSAAQEELAAVLARRPDEPDALDVLARSHMSAGQFARAREIYESLLKTQPDNAQVRLGLAETALELNERRRARREADAAVKMAPANIDVLTRAATIHQDLGRDAEAAKLLERAAELDLQSGLSNSRRPQ